MPSVTEASTASLGKQGEMPFLFFSGTRLFDFLKEETMRAFYTSRMGLKELDYQ
jgi:hypothetical protein